MDITPRENHRTGFFFTSEFFSCFFVRLVFEETLYQFFARIDLVALFVHLFPRDQHLSLYSHERGGDKDKFGGQIDIKAFEGLDIGQKVVGDLGDGDIIDIQFVPFDKEQEEVKGTFKGIDPYRISRFHRLHLAGKDINMAQLRGRLFLLPSPIAEGSLEAISPESIRILHSLDVFIVERARTARRFISATKPARSIEELRIEEMPEDMSDHRLLEAQMKPLLEGKDVGLLSEAGLPAIADPGNRYVALAHRMGVRVIPIAGPSSIIMALIASGLEGQRFAFHGYLSAKKEELGHQLKDLEHRADRDRATQIWIETPYRNKQIIEAAEKYLNPGRRFCIAAGLGNESGWVLTKTILDWKRNGWPEVHKVPAVFLLA